MNKVPKLKSDFTGETSDNGGAKSPLSNIEDIIEDARNGRIFILVDDEERENEGDLIIPAQMATPDIINFMARYGRGLICLALTRARLQELDLPLLMRRNMSRHQTAFTLSIEAREGVTTGISASDRARTISVAVDPSKDFNDIASPGHIFPLESREGGVLVRAGHTEAAVDVARLAGLNPSGVICEIMNDDGTMARLPDLITFAQFHKLKIATIADLIAYRLKHDTLIERVAERTLDSYFGGVFQMFVYANKETYGEHVAIVKGDISGDSPVLVRMHALNILNDVLGDTSIGKSGELQEAMQIISNEGRGAIVLIRESDPSHLSNQIRRRSDTELRKVSESGQLRDYGVGAQILLDIGIRKMILLSNTQHTVIGLEGYGISIVGQQPIKI